MELSLENIRRRLEQRGFTLFGYGDQSKELGSFRLLTGGERPRPDVLNVLPLSEYLDISGCEDCCFLCCADCRVPDGFPGTGARSLLFCREQGRFMAAVNAVSEVFADALFISSRAAEIFAALCGPRSLMGALDAAGRAIGRKMVLGDASRVVLVHNLPDVPIEEQDWDVFIAAGVAPAFSGEEGSRINSELILPCGDRLSFVENRRFGVRNAICDIYLGDRMLACLSILIDEGGLSGRDLGVISALCEAVRQELSQRSRPDISRSLPYESFLIGLLENRTSDPEHIRILASKLSYPAEGFFAVFAFELPAVRDGHGIPVRELLGRLESALLGSRAVNYDGKVVVLVNFHRKGEFASQDYAELLGCIERYGLYCGMSRPFRSLSEVRRHYSEALDACAFGRFAEFVPPEIVDGRICYYEKCEPYLFVHAAMEHGVDLSKYIHPFAQKLQRYDEEHDTEYIRTLFVYIRTPRKLQAAEALYIHRNTLDYRLKKIQELVQFSWDDGETLARLYLSIVALLYLEMRRKHEQSLLSASGTAEAE